MLGFIRNLFAANRDPELMAKAKQLVMQLIEQHPVMMFSKSYCPYCVKAKRALNAELGGVNYEVLELENRQDCAEIQDYLLSFTGARSVPRVFIKGKCIGGGNETVALQNSGQLKQLLIDAGALRR